MDYVVKCPFAGGMYNRDADVNSENSRTRARWKFPTRAAGVAAAGDGLDGQHAPALAVGRAGIDDRPTIEGKLTEGRVKVIHEIANGSGRGLGQRSTRWINIARRSADVRELHPQRLHLVISPRVKPSLPDPAIRIDLLALRVGDAEMQVRPRRVAGGAAGADYFAVRNVGAVGKCAGLHGNGAKMPIPGVVAVRVPQADVYSQVAAVVLRVIPARINNLIGICSGQNRSIAYSVINPIMAVIECIRSQFITPVTTITVIAQPIGRLCATWRRVWTGFIQRFALISNNFIVRSAVSGIAVIENRLFGGTSIEGRVEERRDQFRRARGNTAREMNASKQGRPGQGNHQQDKFGKQAQARVH